MINIKLPSYLTSYIEATKSSKSRAWYIMNCVKYCYENNINIYEYYEGITNEGIKEVIKKREG